MPILCLIDSFLAHQSFSICLKSEKSFEKDFLEIKKSEDENQFLQIQIFIRATCVLEMQNNIFDKHFLYQKKLDDFWVQD